MSLLNTSHRNIRNLFTIFSLLFIIVIVTYGAFLRYSSVLDETREALTKKVIAYHLETFKNFAKIVTECGNENFITRIGRDKAFRSDLEDQLRLIRTSSIQNLFVVYKEADSNRYFFLLDSEQNMKERAELFQPFEPVSDVWDLSYQTQSVEIYHHNDTKKLWITVAVPLIQNGTTVALLGADISYTLDEAMQLPLEHFGGFFLWISLISIAWFSLMYLSTLYFRGKYKEGYLDPLTKVFNRRYLNDVLLKKLGREYQLIIIDIDHFKRVNDTYGHIAGDAVLQEVATRMQELMRSDDILIRFGGEEFLVYTTGLSEAETFELAERLRVHIAQTPIHYKDITINITISLGVHATAQSRDSFKDMLKLADSALYEAKEHGRNRVCLSEKSDL